MKIINQVYETLDYSVFKSKEGNRELKENLKLEAELKSVGMLVPIIINEKYEVIDGQHRLRIAKKHNIPVKYIIVEGAGEKEIISINNTAVQWTPRDFVNLYKKAGNENYIKFDELLEKYDVLIGVLASISQNTTDGHRPIQSLKSGELKFANYDFLIDFLEFHQELIDKTVLEPSGALTKSLYVIYRLKKLDEDRLFDKSGLIAQKLKGVTKQGMMTKIILETYNSRLRAGSENEIKFHFNAKGNVEFFEVPKDEIRNVKGTTKANYRLM